MEVAEKRTDHLEKCYSIAPFTDDGQLYFLLASEKYGGCHLYDENGTRLETVWDGPAGVMTMQQIPGRPHQFLATKAFYSPNDSKEARIVLADRKSPGNWEARTFVEAPFVHRFGILEKNGICYLLVCCLKSGHDCKDDWSHPGTTWYAVLPDDPGCGEESRLELKLLMDGMFHNHGFSLCEDREGPSALVTCDSGVWQFIPPDTESGQWKIRHLYDEPVSDAVLLDLDGDGEAELGCISPFHGDELYVCKKDRDGRFARVWTHPDRLEMLHATWACRIEGRPVWIVGHRKGAQDLYAVSFENGAYQASVVDHGSGSANAFAFTDSRGRDVIIAANREHDEAAFYYLRSHEKETKDHEQDR